MGTHSRVEKCSKVALEKCPPPSFEQCILDREIPSDVALVVPLVIRTVELLRQQSLVTPGAENRVGLCLEEALRNAVIHGNKSDFTKKARLRVFRTPTELVFMVSDEGAGFDPGAVKNPVLPEGLWGESGRGLYLIAHYMERMTFYCDGSTLVMNSSLPGTV